MGNSDICSQYIIFVNFWYLVRFLFWQSDCQMIFRYIVYSILRERSSLILKNPGKQQSPTLWVQRYIISSAVYVPTMVGGRSEIFLNLEYLAIINFRCKINKICVLIIVLSRSDNCLVESLDLLKMHFPAWSKVFLQTFF